MGLGAHSSPGLAADRLPVLRSGEKTNFCVISGSSCLLKVTWHCLVLTLLVLGEPKLLHVAAGPVVDHSPGLAADRLQLPSQSDLALPSIDPACSRLCSGPTEHQGKVWDTHTEEEESLGSLYFPKLPAHLLPLHPSPTLVAVPVPRLVVWTYWTGSKQRFFRLVL